MEGRFPQNEPARRLFLSLLRRLEEKRFDDAFLEDLVAYHQAFPESERYEVLYAEYALAHGAPQVALEYGLKAYEKRKACPRIWRLLSRTYHALKYPLAAAPFDGLLARHAGGNLSAEVARDDVEALMKILSLAMSDPRPAPFLTHEMVLKSGTELDIRQGVAVGGYLPSLAEEQEASYRYWVGVYNPGGMYNERGEMMAIAAQQGISTNICYSDVFFDVVKSKLVTELEVDAAAGDCLLPTAGTCSDQPLRVKAGALDETAKLGMYEYSFFRVTEPTKFSSEQAFAVGAPILLRHAAPRKKLVLNLFVDALSWSIVRRHQYRWMPRVMEFFSRGIIFDNNYSVSEYTYPSVATIETGRLPLRNQIFNPRVFQPLAPSCPTLSERMKEAGYYAVMLAGGGSLGMYNGVLRGFDRMIMGKHAQSVAVAVERTIQYLEAFGETDNYLLFHVDDVHPYGDEFPPSEKTQTQVPLSRRFEADNDKVSVLLAKSYLNEYQNEQNIKRVDRSLGYLFDYLTSRYQEEEYIVHLYSDHGASVYSEHPWFLSEEQTSAALMMRGGGVPERGLVKELTSALDIFPIVLHNAGLSPVTGIDGNLPAALGGKARRYVLSNSLYPNQTFKVCLRTQPYEFRWETEARTRFDGRVDRSRFRYDLYTRDEAHKAVRDEAAEEKFLQIIERYTRSAAENGECWPDDDTIRWEKMKHHDD